MFFTCSSFAIAVDKMSIKLENVLELNLDYNRLKWVKSEQFEEGAPSICKLHSVPQFN